MILNILGYVQEVLILISKLFSSRCLNYVLFEILILGCPIVSFVS